MMSVNQLVSSDQLAHNMFDGTKPEDLSTEEIGNRLAGYAGQVAALTARFLILLAEFDRRGGWGGDGIRSCAHWLSWRTGLSIRTAQDHVRVAHALTDLPLMCEAFEHGRLSYSKVRALTRVTTPDREAELLGTALSSTASQVERLVSAMRNIDRKKDEFERGAIDSRGLWRWNLDGSLSVNLRLSSSDGAQFLAGVVRAEYERTRSGSDADLPMVEGITDSHGSNVREVSSPDLWRNVPTDIAPAAVAMAETMQAAVDVPEFVPGAEIVVHQQDNAESSLDGGPAIDSADVDELACGGAVRQVRHGNRGVVLAYGRKRRLPTRRLMRVLFERDRCCRHPGCGRTRYLHAHHVRFWSAGGTTDPGNLILLCSAHHRALHHGEFAIDSVGAQQFTFHRADGSIIENAPPIQVSGAWHPDGAVAADAVVPTNAGRLDVGYATEVLYAAWEWRFRHREAVQQIAA